MTMQVNPANRHFGAEVTGVSGTELADPATAAKAESLIEQYGVVVFRDAFISDDDLISFSEHLGELVVQPTGEHERPEIQPITTDPSKANPMMRRIRKGNFLWHIDGATDETPQKGTFLAARVLDDSGEGHTQFASTYIAYDRLSPAEQKRISGLQVEHSFGTAMSRAISDPTDEERAHWATMPARIHPLVWRRRDGRCSLLLGATAGCVVGWNQAESDELLNDLLARATEDQYILEHNWREGDLVGWDNTGMLHRAMPFQPTSHRLMHRTTLQGVEEVVGATAEPVL